MKTALLLSGGMDSICLAWWQRPEVAITINYGQLAAAAEINASSAICRALSMEQHVVHSDLRALGSGDMAGRENSDYAPDTDWWPYRNQLLITLAAMKAIAIGATRLVIGTVSSDGSHADGTPDFLSACRNLLLLQEGRLSLEAPAISLSTVELVQQSGIPMELLAWAHSCHKSDVICGRCRGCNKYFSVLQDLSHGLA